MFESPRPARRVAVLTLAGMATTAGVALFAAPGMDTLAVMLWPAVVLGALAVGAVLRLVWTPSRDLETLRGQLSQPTGRRRELSSLVSGRPSVQALARTVLDFEEALEEGLSEKREARVEAEEADRTETAFLTDLSHELRTPLNAILGFSDVLLGEMDGPLNESQREDVETIKTAGSHLSELVDDVLDLASLYSGTVTLRRTEFPLAPLVHDVVRLLEAQRRGKTLSVRAEVADDVGSIYADDKRLRQVLMNLGTNAIKFTERGGIVLRVVRVEGNIRLSVSDTGPGIARSEQDTIFLEFTQLAGSVRKSQGSGLGLAICKRLTELHGGRIWLDSVVGEGSTFHVELPSRESP